TDREVLPPDDLVRARVDLDDALPRSDRAALREPEIVTYHRGLQWRGDRDLVDLRLGRRVDLVHGVVLPVRDPQEAGAGGHVSPSRNGVRGERETDLSRGLPGLRVDPERPDKRGVSGAGVRPRRPG